MIVRGSLGFLLSSLGPQDARDSIMTPDRSRAVSLFLFMDRSSFYSLFSENRKKCDEIIITLNREKVKNIETIFQKFKEKQGLN